MTHLRCDSALYRSGGSIRYRIADHHAHGSPHYRSGGSICYRECAGAAGSCIYRPTAIPRYTSGVHAVAVPFLIAPAIPLITAAAYF